MVYSSYSFSAHATPTAPPDPILRPGLWEIVTTESARKDFESIESICVGSNAQEVQLAKQDFDAKRGACKLQDVQSGTSQISYTAVCSTDYDVTNTYRVSIEGDFSDGFTRTQTASFSISVPYEGMINKQRFKYTSACPKEMAPGDIIMKFRDGHRTEKWNRYNLPQPSKSNTK